MPDDPKYTLRRPEPGRPSDKRVTPEFLALRPRLAGTPAFDPARDVDAFDEVERVLSNVRADVAFASEELGEQLTAVIEQGQQVVEQGQAVLADYSQVRVVQIDEATVTLASANPAAFTFGTYTTPNGFVLETVEIEL